MKRDFYKPTSLTLGDHKCVKMKHHVPYPDIIDLTLSGKYGEIWEQDEEQTTFKAVIKSPAIANKYLPENKRPLIRGDEVVITFPRSELELWCKRLKVPLVMRSYQARYANSFFRKGT